MRRLPSLYGSSLPMLLLIHLITTTSLLSFVSLCCFWLRIVKWDSKQAQETVFHQEESVTEFIYQPPLPCLRYWYKVSRLIPYSLARWSFFSFFSLLRD